MVAIMALMGGCGNVDPTNTTASQQMQFQPLEYSQIYSPGDYQPDANAETGESLHYVCDGFFGDVHPFYGGAGTDLLLRIYGDHGQSGGGFHLSADRPPCEKGVRV